ncbi:MAG: hypothetical protein ACTSUE_15115 [Promethearchaeota archaeon]
MVKDRMGELADPSFDRAGSTRRVDGGSGIAWHGKKGMGLK